MRALRVRYKVIGGCEDPLPMLVRYRLFDTPCGSLNVHCFLRGDHDRAVHDHPFAYTTLILSGGYVEHTPVCNRRGEPLFNADGTPITVPTRRRAGDLLRRPALWAHRVELIDGTPAWTLIWIGRKSREWGFYTALAWLPWRTYHQTAGCAGEEA